jgi:hypothetical protein
MTAAAVVRAAVTAGVSVRLDGDSLVLSAAKRPDAGLLEDLRREKTKIVDYLRSSRKWTDEDWEALFDERAGILEFDGGLSPAGAEGRAREKVETLRRLVADKPDG